MNPELNETVDKTAVNKVISSLMYIAVNLCQKFVDGMPSSAEKEQSLSYIAKCNKNRKAFAIQLTENLGDDITQEELTEVMKQFYRSYDLRMSISGDKQAELEDQ